MVDSVTATGPLPNSTRRPSSSHVRRLSSQPEHFHGECCDERTRTPEAKPRGACSLTGPLWADAVSVPSAHLVPARRMASGPFWAVSSIVPLPPS